MILVTISTYKLFLNELSPNVLSDPYFKQIDIILNYIFHDHLQDLSVCCNFKQCRTHYRYFQHNSTTYVEVEI
jgi:hypothetical protein